MNARKFSSRLPQLLTMLGGVAAAGCTSNAPVQAPAPAPVVQSAPAPAPVPAVRTSEPTRAPANSGSSVAGQSRTFSTQHATYTSVSFDAIPGWGKDDFSESWDAFVASCRVLGKRASAWREVCERSQRVDGKSAGAIRGFYEREFAVYQIRDDDRRTDGVVTGYFEPQIEGSKTYAPPFIYPVYAQPDDMLFLDARSIPSGAGGAVVARLQGKNVAIQRGMSARDAAAAGLYTLDLSSVGRDTLDRRIRLRADGRQLLPYYTREEIETKGAPNARVIAFVNNAAALYELQVQGSGRIKLSNGEVIRIGYAEQNGQPFRPTVARASNGKPKGVRVRGSSIELELDDEDESDARAAVLTRGFTLAKPERAGAVAVPGQRATQALTGSGIKDPSYVFFKEIPSSNDGAVGALGVPLTAGRSIAVDPRSTPLGYPVFVSTRQPNSNTPMQRLTFAQDTGGAIRGAVRADYFFGFGQDAASNARRMKQPGQMWVLLPRGLTVAASTNSSVRVRGGGLDLAECLVPDEDICVEDR